MRLPDLAFAQDVLDAAVDVDGAGFGALQILDANGDLRLVASRGFGQEWAGLFQLVRQSAATTCGKALRVRRRVISHDITSDPEVGDYRELAAAFGLKAAQSTPLLSRQGRIIGMLTTHYARHYDPTAADLDQLDYFARIAGGLLECSRLAHDLALQGDGHTVPDLSPAGQEAAERAVHQLALLKRHARDRSRTGSLRSDMDAVITELTAVAVRS